MKLAAFNLHPDIIYQLELFVSADRMSKCSVSIRGCNFFSRWLDNLIRNQFSVIVQTHTEIERVCRLQVIL